MQTPAVPFYVRRLRTDLMSVYFNELLSLAIINIDENCRRRKKFPAYILFCNQLDIIVKSACFALLISTLAGKLYKIKMCYTPA